MVKDKRDGNIKGRVCADCCKKCLYIEKADVALPTVQLESLVLSLLVDAHEGKDVAILDVVEAYLLEDMEYYVVIKLSGEVVHIMCKVKSRYVPYQQWKSERNYYAQDCLKCYIDA